jgi:hypothetical protein
VREELHGGLAWGERLGGDLPEGQLAELEVEHKATPRRIEAARRMFEEAALDDFEPYGIRDKLRHKVSGVVYAIGQEQVLMARDPRRTGVDYFIVAGDRLWFLRPRGWSDAECGVPGELIAGELRRSPGGGVQVVDRRTGAVVREQLKL